MTHLHTAEWYYVADDPGVPAGELLDPLAGLDEHAAGQVRLLLEGKAIGTAQLSANVLARDSAIRQRVNPTEMQARLRRAVTNVARLMRPLIREDAQGVPRGEIRQVMRQLMREWLAGQRTYEQMRLESAQRLRGYYEQMRQIGRAGAGLEAMGAPTRVQREEEDWFRGAVREELEYWHTFLRQVHEGAVPPDQVWGRVDAYIRAMRAFFESTRVQALPDNVLVYWVGPKPRDPDICEGCRLMMEWSPFPKSQLPASPRDGSTPCLTNCRHRLLIRVARNFNDVVRRSNQLDRMRIETRTRPSGSQPRERMVQRLREAKDDAWHGGSRTAIQARQASIRASKPGGEASNPFRGETLPAVPDYKGRIGQLRMEGKDDPPDADGKEMTEAAIRTTPYNNFDAIPYSTMDLRDVARLLQRAADTRDKQALLPLVDRLLGALEHTVVAVEGRPRGKQVAQMFRAAFVSLVDALDDLPESYRPKVGRLHELMEGLAHGSP